MIPFAIGGRPLHAESRLCCIVYNLNTNKDNSVTGEGQGDSQDLSQLQRVVA